MSAFLPSTRFESWITRLRQPWMSIVGRRIWGGFAAVLGDRTLDWGTRANLEHLPQYASPPAVALTASERQIDAGPHETTASLAARLVRAVPAWQAAGSPLGLLAALHYAEFDHAVVVQQNGRAFRLTLPYDPDNPTASLVISNVGINPNWATDPPWWTMTATDLDANGQQFASRFWVLFPGPLPGIFTTTATATFSAASTAAAVWSNPFDDTDYLIATSSVIVASGGTPPSVGLDGSTKTKGGITVVSSAAFTGTVHLIAWAVGDNPFANLHASDLARLRNVIRKWAPRKATCIGIVALVQGRLWGWPVQTWGALDLWGPNVAVQWSA